MSFVCVEKYHFKYLNIIQQKYNQGSGIITKKKKIDYEIHEDKANLILQNISLSKFGQLAF